MQCNWFNLYTDIPVAPSEYPTIRTFKRTFSTKDFAFWNVLLFI